MNSKFLTIAGILLVALVVFSVALTHTQNEATSVTTTIAPYTSTPAATDASQGFATTSASVIPAPTRAIQKPVPVSASAMPASTAVAITIKNYMFGPQTVTVKKGTTVIWTNTDIAKHTVTSDDGTWPASHFFGQGESYSYTFSTPGTYKYHCEPHPYMTAVVIVTE